MTTYTYKCLDCENIFDIQATIQDREESKGDKFICPKCQSKNIKQQFSPANFVKNIFKSGVKTGGCCSGGDVCDIGCKPNDEKNNDCDTKNNGCCG
jgi:putative FmdB family regulatory protein